MSIKSSRGQLVFRSSLLYVWVTRGPFGRRSTSLCDFGDTTPHTLVGGAQTTLTARASVRADRRNDPREAWGPRGDTQSRPARGFGPVRGGHRGRRDGPQYEAPFLVIDSMTTAGKGLTCYRGEGLVNVLFAEVLLPSCSSHAWPTTRTSANVTTSSPVTSSS